MNAGRFLRRNVHAGKLVSESLHVLIFGGFVLAMFQVIAVVIESPQRRVTIVMLLTVGSIGLILIACVWLLRKLWTVSGTLAAQIVPKDLLTPSPALAEESKREDQA